MIRFISSGLAAVAASFTFTANRRVPVSQMEFALEDFFAGRAVAHARFSTINGIKRDFRIDVSGVWEGNKLTLREEFEFDDGEIDTKTWHFRKIADGKYVANREDMLRPVEATIRNGTLRYTYLLYLDPAQKKSVVRFRDRITMVNRRMLKNTAIVYKFGIPVGLVTGTFVKNV